jgi:hypothetical protein
MARMMKAKSERPLLAHMSANFITRLMLIHVAALFDKRRIWHVKLHDNLSSLVIVGLYGNCMRTKDFL